MDDEALDGIEALIRGEASQQVPGSEWHEDDMAMLAALRALRADNARLRARLADALALAEVCRSGWTRNLTTVAWHVGPRGRTYEQAQAAAEADVAEAIESWREATAAEGGAS